MRAFLDDGRFLCAKARVAGSGPGETTTAEWIGGNKVQAGMARLQKVEPPSSSRGVALSLNIQVSYM